MSKFWDYVMGIGLFIVVMGTLASIKTDTDKACGADAPCRIGMEAPQ